MGDTRTQYNIHLCEYCHRRVTTEDAYSDVEATMTFQVLWEQKLIVYDITPHSEGCSVLQAARGG